MKYFLSIVLFFLSINCFSQNWASSIDDIRHSMDSLYKEYPDLIRERFNGLQDGDTMILIPTFYASQKYMDIARKSNSPDVIDFEKSTGLKRTDIFQYINYHNPFVNDALIYRSNQFLGIAFFLGTVFPL